MVEIELSVLAGQCLADRMQRPMRVKQQISAWEERRSQRSVHVDWRFTTADARIRLERLYPSLQA